MAIIALLQKAIREHRVAAAAGGVAVIVVVTGGVVLLKTNPSVAASQPRGIPTTMAQIRAEARKDPRLAELGLLWLRQSERTAHVDPLFPLTAAQRAADAKWIQQQQAEHSSPANQKAPADASGLFPILKSGTGPWSSCEFFGHNLYVSPPKGSSGIQFLIYAGNIPPTKACVDNPRSINVPTAGYGGIFEATWNNPNHSANSPTLVRSSVDSPLMVVSASGNTVVLQSLSGQRVTFDMVTRKFGA
jgi:hypothetical protein